MSRSRLALATLLAALCVTPIALTVSPGVAPAAPVPTHLFPKKEPEPDYFPSRVGTTRVYEVMDLGDEKHECTEVVTGVESEEGAKIIRTEVSWTGKRSGSEVRAVKITSNGFFLSNFGPPTYSKPVCVFKRGCRSGESWETDTVDESPGGFERVWHDRFQTWVATVGDFEVIEVPSGTFRSLRVELTRESKDRGMPSTKFVTGYTSWYAPEIGIVKEERHFRDDYSTPDRTIYWSRVLKSFTPGKE